MADATPITKTCTACRAEKPLDAFSPEKLGRYGRRAKCKPCVTALTKARYQVSALPPSKVCFGCALEKPASEFYRQKYSPDGLTSRCRACHNKAPSRDPKVRRDEAAQRALREGRSYKPRGPRNDDRRRAAALREIERGERAARQIWRWWLQDGAPASWLTAYWSSHPKPWTNPRLTPAEKERTRRATNIDYQIAKRLSERQKKLRRQGRLHWCILRALKDGGTSPTVETELGYTIANLRVHLERQFTRGMTWAKFLKGEIHIDHRIPTVEFDLSKPDEIRACFAITNLQPMWAQKNIQKGAKRLVLL